MTTTVIHAERLSKVFSKRHQELRHLLEALLRRKKDYRDENRWLWAVKDVSFQIQEKEVIGVIGENGAGKSVLLKLLSGVTKPTGGRVTIRGTVSSMLEVSSGFHPELTARENIYLTAVIMGMKLSEVKAKFDSMVEFAGLNDFLDTPVKRFSSGMVVKLAFAIVSQLKPDILILDEVLSVSDESFVKKSKETIKEFNRQGCTLLIVSHNPKTIKELCNKVLWLDNGSIKDFGETKLIMEHYLNTTKNGKS